MNFKHHADERSCLKKIQIMESISIGNRIFFIAEKVIIGRVYVFAAKKWMEKSSRS